MTTDPPELHVIEGGGEGGDPPSQGSRERVSWWRDEQRRIRKARDRANKLGLRLSNLRSVDNTHADLWVLAVPRSFDEVEAELLERMRQREHFQDHTYATAYPPVWTDTEQIENGDGESVPVQYISVNTCRQCGAMVHEQTAHSSWHTWMRSLHEWMARRRHGQVTSPTSANERAPSSTVTRPGVESAIYTALTGPAGPDITGRQHVTGQAGPSPAHGRVGGARAPTRTGDHRTQHRPAEGGINDR